MSQREVYDFLKRLRETGDDRYYTVRNIRDMLQKEGTITAANGSLSNDLTQLWWYGFVEKADCLGLGPGKLLERRQFRSK